MKIVLSKNNSVENHICFFLANFLKKVLSSEVSELSCLFANWEYRILWYLVTWLKITIFYFKILLYHQYSQFPIKLSSSGNSGVSTFFKKLSRKKHICWECPQQVQNFLAHYARSTFNWFYQKWFGKLPQFLAGLERSQDI